MNEDLLLSIALGVVALVLFIALVVVLVTWRRDRARAEAQAAVDRAEQEQLRERVDALARRLDTHRDDARPAAEEFVITDIGDHDQGPPAPVERIEGRLFADIVLRETAVKAASFGVGVRRALAAENRNRIRFEMKREVKRARKQRRAELKDLRRERAARQRAEEGAA